MHFEIIEFKRNLKIRITTREFNEIKDGKTNEILELKLPDRSIYVGDILHFKHNDINSCFKIHKIIRIDSVTYELLRNEVNKSFYFVLPQLGHNFKWFGWDDYLIDVFIENKDDKNPFGENHEIYCLYRFDTTERFQELDKRLRENECFLGTYDPDYFHTMYVFNIENIHDLNKIIVGKYSEITQKTKDKILEFHGLKIGDSMIKNILTKNKVLKDTLEKNLGMCIPDDLELFSKINMESETYKA